MERLTALGDSKVSRDNLRDINSMVLEVFYRDPLGQDAKTEAYLTTHFSPFNRHIKVTSSTENARVRNRPIFIISLHRSVEYPVLRFSYF